MAVSELYRHAVSKCRIYHKVFNIPCCIVISTRWLFNKRKLTIAYSELGKIVKEVDISIDEDFILHVPMAFLTDNMLPGPRSTLMAHCETLVFHLEAELLTRLIP